MEIYGKISSIETMGLMDGPGVRFVAFLQGCNLRCAYCHNPETWDQSLGETISARELVNKILKYKTYFGENGGVTLSGGEPLLQEDFVAEVFKLCKQNHIHTCLDTAGHTKSYKKALEYCDLVILDIKELDAQKYQELTGAKLDYFNEFLSYVQQKNIPLWLRQVIVPGFNDTKEDVLKLKNFAKNLKNVQKIELLPYHNMGEKKYKELKLPYRLKGTPQMDKEKCGELEELLKD